MRLNKLLLEIQLASQGMLIQELCKNARISKRTLLSALNGESKTRPATIGKISKALNVDVKEIIQKGEDL